VLGEYGLPREGLSAVAAREALAASGLCAAMHGGHVHAQLRPGLERRSAVLARVRLFTWGRYFVHFFHGISWKNDFSKLFPWKIPFFPNIFVGKRFRGIFPEIYNVQNVQKRPPLRR
jgi:hypothetical protein